MSKTISGKEDCPGYLQWSAFGARYMDTVCSSALEWQDGYQAWGLCDADDDFREKGVPCPFCDSAAFIEYVWGSPEEYAVLWELDESPAGGAEIHFHDGQALWWSATHPDRGEERVLIRRLEMEDG